MWPDWPQRRAVPPTRIRPASDAPAVRALVEAGALCIGKTNLDQFATGLVGTRSPYGAVRCAVDPGRIAGGSSSGSAVAVALGQVDVSLGTDTAGSGRVPAALNGIVGLKGTLGTVSTTGVVPACRSFDCVSVFAREIALAEAALTQLTGPRGDAPDRRAFPSDMALAPPARPTVAIPDEDTLSPLPPGWVDAFRAACAVLESSGCALVRLDLGPFLRAGQLLYGGAFVAERHAAVGDFVDGHRDDVDPTVGAIISAAAGISATDLADDQATLAASPLRRGPSGSGSGPTRCSSPPRPDIRPSKRSRPTQWGSTSRSVGSRRSSTCSTCAPSRCRPATSTACPSG